MRNRKTLLSLLIGLFVASPLAMAQGQPQSQPQERTGQSQEREYQQQRSSNDISDDKIDEFVDIYAEVKRIENEYDEKLREADNPQESQELRRELENKKTAKIEDSDMNTDEFRDVEMAMLTDTEIRETVNEQLEEKGINRSSRR